MIAEIAVRLATVHESPGWTVTRFDQGAPFTGRVAVLSSAFNPPTHAHVSLLELAASVEGVTGVAAMLTTNNVDKSLFGAPLSHRVGMLLALGEAEPGGVAVLASNAARFVDQAEALRVIYPGAGFDFVAGFDTLVRIFDRRYYDDIETVLGRLFEHHRLIVTNRAQATVDAVAAFVDTAEVRPYAHGIIVRELDDHPASLSSTQAREHAERGEVPPAVPPAVGAYIARHGLYGMGGDSR